MNTRIYRLSAAGILVAALLPFSAAYAQLGSLLKQEESSGGSSALGNLGGMGSALSGSSMTSGSLGNVAGLLQFCIKNNYLSGDGAAAVQSALMGKLPGGASTSDSGYTSGVSGLLSRQRRWPVESERWGPERTDHQKSLRPGAGPGQIPALKG